MKRAIISVVIIISVLVSGINVWASETSGDSSLHKFLESVTVFKSGEITALDKDNLVQLSEDNKAAIIENQTAYVPEEYAKKNNIQSENAENGYVRLSNCYIYEDLCYVASEEIDIPSCNRYANNIKRLFGVYIDASKNGTGTKDSPIGDIQAAVNSVKSIKNTIGLPKGEFPVYFRGGIYPISKSIVFDGGDSGNETTRIVYMSYPGENASVRGGVSISGSDFTKVTDTEILNRVDKSVRNKLYSVDLKKFGLSDFGENVMNVSVNPKSIQLIYNNEPATISRWPNNELVKTEKILIANGEWTNPGFEFVFTDKRLQRWKNAKTAWVWGTWTWEWAAENHQVKKIDTEKQSILTATNSQYTPAEGKEWYI